jgi:hypothetical protein
MTRFEKRVLVALGLLMLVLSLLEASVPEPVDWSRSFSREHTRPYGAKLLYQRLGDLFPAVRTVNDADLGTRLDRDGQRSNHLFVNDRFRPDLANTEHLLELAARGDRVLIAAERIIGPLADSLGIEMGMDFRAFVSDTVDIRFVGEARITRGVYRFSQGFTRSHFTDYDKGRGRVLAVDGSSNPVLLELAHGEGRFVLCSTPLALTNYNLLKDDNATYLAGVLSVLPPWPVLWDEHHKAGRVQVSTPLRWILSQPALRWAWALGWALVLLHMLLHVRREQRAIPVMEPPRNATRELVHTIGRLYWHKADHAALARRMIAHFKEEVRVATYLRTFAFDQATMTHLASKAGLDLEECERRLQKIEQRERASHLGEHDLLQLSNELHEFRQMIRSHGTTTPAT